MSLLYCPLPNVGIVTVEGRDAAAFLHAQLSQEIATLDVDRAPLAGWHDPRGRVRALFRVLRLPERFLLAAPADSLAATARDLQRFILRAEVRLAPADGWAAAGLVGAATGLHGTPLPERDRRSEARGVHLVGVAPGLWHAFGEREPLAALAEQCGLGTPAIAAAAAIRSGLPTIGAALAGRFVAQMVNLDALGAISFTKGCYPGQEIVARTHHLGTVKRRMRRFSADVPLDPAPAAEIVDGGGAVVGEVVCSAPTDRGTELLAVVAGDARGGTLLLDGAPLTEQPLPYTLA